MSIRKHWKITALVLFVLLTLLFSEGFRKTVVRRHAISKTSAEYEALSTEVDALKKKIARLENDPSAVEEYVRKDLGYLRPGEKEIRFIDNR